jgi:hypothetical protein
MLDTGIHQASGLEKLADQRSTRLVAAGSHGQQQGELPLLWGLCSAWVEQGFSVLVLDGHALETAQNPGLWQCLQSAGSASPAMDTDTAWAVWPAARGLAALGARADALHALGELFPHVGVLLLYTPAAVLTPLLRGSHSAPLLVVPPLHQASVSAYEALKQWVIDAQLQPTVAHIALDDDPRHLSQHPSPIQKLQQCARAFLGYGISPVTVSARARLGDSAGEVQRLALQLLEGAVPLGAPFLQEAS